MNTKIIKNLLSAFVIFSIGFLYFSHFGEARKRFIYVDQYNKIHTYDPNTETPPFPHSVNNKEIKNNTTSREGEKRTIISLTKNLKSSGSPVSKGVLVNLNESYCGSPLGYFEYGEYNKEKNTSMLITDKKRIPIISKVTDVFIKNLKLDTKYTYSQVLEFTEGACRGIYKGQEKTFVTGYTNEDYEEDEYYYSVDSKETGSFENNKKMTSLDNDTENTKEEEKFNFSKAINISKEEIVVNPITLVKNGAIVSSVNSTDKEKNDFQPKTFFAWLLLFVGIGGLLILRKPKEENDKNDNDGNAEKKETTKKITQS